LGGLAVLAVVACASCGSPADDPHEAHATTASTARPPNRVRRITRDDVTTPQPASPSTAARCCGASTGRSKKRAQNTRRRMTSLVAIGSAISAPRR